MQLIPLTRGYCAEVDDEDFGWLSQWKWTVECRSATQRYAYRQIRRKGTCINLKMHRVIAEKYNFLSAVIDHVDGNGLNNCRANLRSANQHQNLANRRKTKGSSRFKGVYWRNSEKKWMPK